MSPDVWSAELAATGVRPRCYEQILQAGISPAAGPVRQAPVRR